MTEPTHDIQIDGSVLNNIHRVVLEDAVQQLRWYPAAGFGLSAQDAALLYAIERYLLR